jgi:hypothetical protein
MEQGIVQYRNLQKGLYVVKVASQNYAVFETYDIMAFKVGDAVFGNFSKCGILDLLNATTLSWSKVIIQEVCCDESLALNKASLAN